MALGKDHDTLSIHKQNLLEVVYFNESQKQRYALDTIEQRNRQRDRQGDFYLHLIVIFWWGKGVVYYLCSLLFSNLIIKKQMRPL